MKHVVGALAAGVLVLLPLAAAAPPPRPDPAEARIARALATPRLRAAFQAERAGWQRRTRACGRDAGCRQEMEAARHAIVAALAARVSDGNPTLPDLAAAAFAGSWTAGTARSLDGVVRPYLLSDGIPAADARVTGRPGELCTPDCVTLGLEPHPLGDGADEQAAASAFGLPPGAPAWLAYLDGRAGWLAIPVRHGIRLLVTSCARPQHDCGPAAIELTPAAPASAIVDLRATRTPPR